MELPDLISIVIFTKSDGGRCIMVAKLYKPTHAWWVVTLLPQLALVKNLKGLRPRTRQLIA